MALVLAAHQQTLQNCFVPIRVLTDYTSEHIDLNDPSIYRDLSKPIGALNERRFEIFKERFDSFDDPDLPPFHYGSHYSSAGIALHYLIRIEPFTTLSLCSLPLF